MEYEGGCDLTLFVACFNEQDGIRPTIETVVAAAQQAGITYDIVIIDDASTDDSVPIIRQFMRDHPQVPITLLVNLVNQGFGANFAAASFYGRGRYYRTICGDDTESVETLVKVFRRLGEADILLTYHTAVVRPIFRRAVSRSFTVLVNFLSGHRLHYYNGLAVHRRDHVMRWHSNSHGFGFQADLVTRLLDMGATYIQIPVIPRERTGGSCKAFTFRNICSVTNSLMQIFIRRVAGAMYPKNVGHLHAPHTITRTPAAAPLSPDAPEYAEATR